MQNSKPVGAAISRPPTFGTERIDQMRNSVRSRAAGSRSILRLCANWTTRDKISLNGLFHIAEQFGILELINKPSWEESVLCDTAILTMTAGNMSLTV